MLTKIKRILILAYAIFLFLATPLTSSADSKRRSSSYIECDCFCDPCICFIQEGDEGNFVKEIIKLLKQQKYLPKDALKTKFTPQVTEAVKQFQRDHDLQPTGTMDDDTLTWLVWDMSPEDLDIYMPIRSQLPESYPYMAYVPTNGGKKRHANPDCCGMYHPRKVSIRNAAACHYDACKWDGCEADREVLLH